jgi:predicted transglutaminase-like cysteine proteinase
VAANKTNRSMSMVSQNKRINIAQTTFAFFNSEIIALLKKRGGFIGQEKWDKLKQINAEINEKIK